MRLTERQTVPIQQALHNTALHLFILLHFMNHTMNSIYTIIFALCWASRVHSFTVTHTTKKLVSSSITTSSSSSSRLFSSSQDEQNERLAKLGFTEEELARSISNNNPDVPQQKVRVDLLPNVDATTITAIGFAAIAFNFFVLANMGDGGIGGVVATIMNTWDN
jgi:hypothetical protein